MTCISDSENYLTRLLPFSWFTRNGGNSESTTSCHKAVLAKQKGTAKSGFKVTWDSADLKTPRVPAQALLYDDMMVPMSISFLGNVLTQPLEYCPICPLKKRS
jgi:hypothetical protein